MSASSAAYVTACSSGTSANELLRACPCRSGPSSGMHGWSSSASASTSSLWLGAGGVDDVAGDHRVEGHARTRTPCATQHVEVVLEVVADLPDRRVLEHRTAAGRITVGRVEVARLLRRASRNVARRARLEADRDAAQVRAHRVERCRPRCRSRPRRRADVDDQRVEVFRGRDGPVVAALDVGPPGWRSRRGRREERVRNRLRFVVRSVARPGARAALQVVLWRLKPSSRNVLRSCCTGSCAGSNASALQLEVDVDVVLQAHELQVAGQIAARPPRCSPAACP